MPNEPIHRRDKGKRYEALVAEYLKSQGYDVMVTNYRNGRNEIDIICQKNDELVFVEVKGGRSAAFGDPVYRVDERKRRAIIKVAEAFLQQSIVTFQSYRFDVVIVKENTSGMEIEHLPAAFTA